MSELVIINVKGKNVVDSRQVADMVEKEHKNLLRDIKQYIEYLGELKIEPSDFFISSTYLNSQNKEQPYYLLTKKGCELVANKLTGAKGVQFTAMYVNKFNEMEVNQGYQVPQTPIEAIKLMLEVQEQTQAEVNDIKARVFNIEENAPLSPSEYAMLQGKVSERIRTIKRERGLEHITREQNSELFKAINREIKVITGVQVRSQIRQKDLKRVLDFIYDWEPSKATMVIINQLSLDI